MKCDTGRKRRLAHRLAGGARPLPGRTGTRLRSLALLLLAAATLGAGVLAHALLPDQTWLPGLYDNTDEDELLLNVSGGSVLDAASTSPALEPRTERVVPAPAPAKPHDRTTRRASRSPPLA